MGVREGKAPAWQRRHPWIVALVAAQAVLLGLAATLDEGVDPAWMLVPAATILGPALGATFAADRREVLAGLSALALSIQLAYAVFALDGEARGSVLMISVLCVVALYESGRVLAVTFAGIAAVIIYVTATDPRLLGLASGNPQRAVETLLISFTASAIAAAALVTMWREFRRARHIAGQQRTVSEAYLEIAPTLIVVMDRAGLVTVANRQTCLTLDRELDDIIGREWFELALPEEYRDEARRLYQLSFGAWEKTRRVSSEPMAYENEVESLDGARRQIVWWGTMIEDQDGDPVGMACSGTDVTDSRALHAELERGRLELDALRRLAQKVASLDDSRQAVVDAAVELAGASSAAILEPDRTRSRITVTTATREAFLGETLELGKESAISASAFLSAQPHFVADCQHAPGVNQRLVEAHGVRSLLHQPILGGAGCVGVLSVLWDEPVDSLQERRAELVGLIAHEASIALRRRESLAQLERAALVDPLTGVANRRAFDAELPTALRRATSGAYPLGLIVLDLNQFKAVNDELGHEAGDEVLIRSASAWANVLRAGDLLARIGGDEFAVLLPECDEVELEHVISRLKRATPHGPGSSMGGAIWDGSESASVLIRRADRAQYADKAAMKAAAGWPTRGAADPSAAATVRPRSEDPRAQDAPSADAPARNRPDDQPPT